MLRVTDCGDLSPKQDISNSPSKDQGTSTEVGVERLSDPEDGKECCETLSSGYEMVTAVMNT